MRLEAGCRLVFDVPDATVMVLMLRPRSGVAQWVVDQRFELTPSLPALEYTDHNENLCQRLTMPAGRLEIIASTTADTFAAIDVAPGVPRTSPEELPNSVLTFLLPSRYCESDKLGELAEEITRGAEPGYDEVEAIRAWIHDHVEYRYGHSDGSTSACDTARDRVGVCRDFSHLGIALCRALNIPARMVAGYLCNLDPMDQHAWFEAFVGGRWYTFDATRDAPQGGRLAIAYGRDAADVAFATHLGPADLEHFEVWVKQL